LVDTTLTLPDLDALAAALDAAALSTALRWLAADCSTRMLAVEVERSVSRIHDLVAAVKRFTYMDRTAAPEAVDLSITLSASGSTSRVASCAATTATSRWNRVRAGPNFSSRCPSRTPPPAIRRGPDYDAQAGHSRRRRRARSAERDRARSPPSLRDRVSRDE